MATEFQNLIYENPAFPGELKEEIYSFLRATFADERKPTDTDEQFLYKTRKKAFGPFKKKLWELPSDVRRQIGADLENKFAFLFERLRVSRTADLLKKTVTPVPIIPPTPSALTDGLKWTVPAN